MIIEKGEYGSSREESVKAGGQEAGAHQLVCEIALATQRMLVRYPPVFSLSLVGHSFVCHRPLLSLDGVKVAVAVKKRGASVSMLTWTAV
jgi:hypothetical protein